MIDMSELRCRLDKLAEILNSYGQMIVALSGGVDSVFLTAFAYKLWGDDRVAALTASGPHFAYDEIEYARQFCDNLGISHKVQNVDFVMPIIRDNPPDRCYHCKKAIFSELSGRAQMVGSVLADGTNLSDMDDYRPGYRALEELGIASPLKEAGLTKDDIRCALHMLADENEALAACFMIETASGESMPIWEKPAFACLASRIPYNEPVTEEKLQSVYDAEKYLHSLGLRQLRVRHHGDVARIEVLPEDREIFFDTDLMNDVDQKIKECGFKFAALDLGGYKMGNMNGEKQNEN